MYVRFRYIKLRNWASFRSNIKSRPTKIRTIAVMIFNIWRLEQDYRHFTHYPGVIMGVMASQITGISIVCSTVCSDADQRKHQNSASLAFVRGIHRWRVNSPHKRPVTRKRFHLMTSSCGRHFRCIFLQTVVLHYYCIAVCSCTISKIRLFLYNK